MKVRALRGVCVGPGSHLAPGDEADLDAATVTFLANIGAVERVLDPPEAAADAADTTNKQAPVKGKKEK